MQINNFDFELRFSNKRKTLQITVDRNGELVISAPEGTPVSAMEEFVKKKTHWIHTKLAQKHELLHPVVPKEYVTGEGFPYLGKFYRLKLVTNQEVPVRLYRGRFCLLRSEQHRGREHLVNWYKDHAQKKLTEKTKRWAPSVGVKPPPVKVMELGYRWGSCSQTLNFNWSTILLPNLIIDYIVVHELCHLIEKNHTKTFWNQVSRVQPNYKQKKQTLAQEGAKYLVV